MFKYIEGVPVSLVANLTVFALVVSLAAIALLVKGMIP